MSDDNDHGYDEEDDRRPRSMGSYYEPLDALPDTAKTLIRIEILEDLSDSQLMWSITDHEVHPSQFMAIISLMANLTSTLADRYTASQAAAQSRMIDHVNEACDRLGVESPFSPKQNLEEGDVSSTLDEIEKYLNGDGDGDD